MHVFISYDTFIGRLEDIQRIETQLIKQLKDYSYRERLGKLGLPHYKKEEWGVI